MSESLNLEDHGYVIIERTGAFFVALDLDRNVHLGFDIFREGDVLTIPGGNLEKSDRNLLVAARRESKQEFGRHMRYQLIDAVPYVFLCDIDTDALVTHPHPGQRVKLRIVWFVMETHGNVPIEQKKPEVRDPRPYKITEKQLETLAMRESSRIALREAFRRKILPKAKYNAVHRVNMESLREQMVKNLVPPHIVNFHCSRTVSSKKDELLRRLELAEQAKQKLERMRERLKKQVENTLKPGTRKNREYIRQSDAMLIAFAEKLTSGKKRA